MIATRDEEGKISPKQTTDYTTNVNGIVANGHDNGVPIFDVSDKEFYQNMVHGRKRVQFKAGTPVCDYHRKTRHSQSFNVRFTDPNGKVFMRKIK